jgi:MFS family permease
MIFFWALFDGIVSFITPLVINNAGLSQTKLGIIIGSSSVFGALFDLLLSKVFTKVHYRRIYLLMLLSCFLYPLILWEAKTIWMYLAAMAIWGLYYDLQNWGGFDAIGRLSTESERSRNFSRLYQFRALGYLIAPILIGLIIGQSIGWKPYVLMMFFIVIACLFYISSAQRTAKKTISKHEASLKQFGFIREIRLWQKVGKVIWPVLMFTMFMYVTDAFFWTLGPLFGEKFGNLHLGSGIFITMYTLPPLLSGWMVSKLTKIFGKKFTAYSSLSLGFLLLALFPLFGVGYGLLILAFLASSFISIAWPSINSAYVDYLRESPAVQKEIEALADSFTNVGYIFGPFFAGLLADIFDIQKAFAVLGGVGCIMMIILFYFTPKKITIKNYR